jgi:hypothetical protein
MNEGIVEGEAQLNLGGMLQLTKESEGPERKSSSSMKKVSMRWRLCSILEGRSSSSA